MLVDKRCTFNGHQYRVFLNTNELLLRNPTGYLSQHFAPIFFV